MFGSSCSITLPTPDSDAHERGWEDVTNARILVVHDDEDSRSLMTAKLRDSGYDNVETVSSDAEALQVVQLRRPEFVIWKVPTAAASRSPPI